MPVPLTQRQSRLLVLSISKMSEHLKDIPEFFENSLGESLSTRTDQLGMKFIPYIPLWNINIFRHRAKKTHSIY